MSSNPSPRIGKVTVHLWNMKYSCHLLLCPCVYIITGVTSCQCVGDLFQQYYVPCIRCYCSIHIVHIFDSCIHKYNIGDVRMHIRIR